MKNRYFSNAPRNHKLEGVKIKALCDDSSVLLLSNSCKTRRNTAKDEQKYQPIFLLVFSGSRVTKSQVY